MDESGIVYVRQEAPAGKRPSRRMGRARLAQALETYDMTTAVHMLSSRAFRPVVSLAVAVTVALASVSLSAGQAAATHTEVHAAHNYRSDSAGATWHWVDELGCVTTDVNVQGVRLAENFHGPELLRLIAGAVSLSSFDSCSPPGQETPLVSGNGYRDDLAPTAFIVSEALMGARLQATIPIFDNVTNSSRDVVIDITWTATSDLTIIGNAGHYVFEGVINAGHELYISREVTATGSVTIEGMEFVSGSSVYADLRRSTVSGLTNALP